MTTTTIAQTLKDLQIGQMVQINNWDMPMQVVGISNKYVLVYDPVVRSESGGHEYSILRKIPDVNDTCWCAPDDWIFGYFGGYHFNDTNWVKTYLSDLENGRCRMSRRRCAPIVFIEVCAP